MLLANVPTDDYPEQMYKEQDEDIFEVPTEDLAPAQTLGISPGDPRMLPFPQNVAVCVLITAIEDLRSGQKKRNADARYCVVNGWLDAWVDRLALDEQATQRVRQLLADLAAGRPQY